MSTTVRAKPYTLDLPGSVASLEDLRQRMAVVLADTDSMLREIYADLAGVSADVAAAGATSSALTSVAVDGAGALSGIGTVGSPLAVQVDNSTVKITTDKLTAPRQAMNVDTTKGLAGDGNVTALSAAVDGSTVVFNGSGQLSAVPPTGFLSVATLTVSDLAGWNSTPKVLLAGTANKANIPTGFFVVAYKNGTAWTNGNQAMNLCYANLTGNPLTTWGNLGLASGGVVKSFSYSPISLANTAIAAIAGVNLVITTALNYSLGTGTTVTFVMPYYQIPWTNF